MMILRSKHSLFKWNADYTYKELKVFNDFFQVEKSILKSPSGKKAQEVNEGIVVMV